MRNTTNSPHRGAVEVHQHPLVNIKVEGVSKLENKYTPSKYERFPV